MECSANAISVKTMHEAHVSVHPTRLAKVQAKEILASLNAVLPMQRARMKVRVSMPAEDGKRVKDRVLQAFPHGIEENAWGSADWAVVGLVDPGQLRVLGDLLESETRGCGRVEVISLSEKVDDV
jgi:ribosome maturation protein SDO1